MIFTAFEGGSFFAADGGVAAVLAVPFFFYRFNQILDIDEPVAGTAKCLRGLALAEAVDHQSILPQALRQPGEIAVRTDKTEAVQLAFVHQVHGINHKRDVGSVFAGCVVALLMSCCAMSNNNILFIDDKKFQA